jgi:leader peptidase (prepilin peptidase)/N-methyltransferase
MSVALAAAFAAPGFAVGSFLNVVAARVPLRRSIVTPRSACMSCGTEIRSRDNIPVVSWLVLRGRCRHCGVRIPVRYLAVELTTGLLVAGCALRFGVSVYALLAASFCVVLVVVSAIDIEHRIIPNIEWPLAALAASLFLLAAAVAYPKGMGMGDVKLALLLGAMLGRTIGVALMVGLLTALAPAAYLVAKHGRAARTIGIPLGPFLALGALVALFAGNSVIHWYLGLSG